MSSPDSKDAKYGKKHDQAKTVHLIQGQNGRTFCRKGGMGELYEFRHEVSGHYNMCKTCLRAKSAIPKATAE